MDIISSSTARRIKPAVSELVNSITQIMDNPVEFISYDYWNVPNNILNFEELGNNHNLSGLELLIVKDWVQKWLKSKGWELNYEVGRIYSIRSDSDYPYT